MNYKKTIIFTLCLILSSSQCSYASEKEQHIKEVKKNLKFIATVGLGIPISIACAAGAVSTFVLPIIKGVGWNRPRLLEYFLASTVLSGTAVITTHYIRKSLLKILKEDREENLFSDSSPTLTESQKNWEFIKGCIATGLVPLSLIALFIATGYTILRMRDPFIICTGLACPLLCWHSAKWAREKLNKTLMGKKLPNDPTFISHVTAQTDEQFPMMDEHI